MKTNARVDIPFEFGLQLGARKPFNENEEHKKKVQKLQGLPFSEELVDIFRHYVHNFIPSARLLENEYWMCSCFPGRDFIPIRVNIYWHEVFRISGFFALPEDELPTWEVILFTDNTVLTPNAVGEIRKVLPDVEVINGSHYAKGLAEQQPIILPVSRYFDLMNEPLVLESIRQYNYKLMQKGKSINKGHNYYLAGLVLE